MKIFNYSTLSLLFTTIMQAVSGYTCPNALTINTKIAENGIMRFPLAERNADADKVFFLRYRGHSNKIEKFYAGESRVDKFAGAYYHPQTQELPASFTCIYKQKNNKYLVLPMTKKGARRVNAATIENEINSNWRALRDTGFYVCGDDGMVKENLDNCQFYLKPR
ncbi:hypothetical protein [Rickettsiella endosymbiont of Miltochrista miniata]|uniref:hypothetical protein n=1 Tax=Rickettsiella endosymbiont of Miltochrista miniata TaxID=3066239 RepID=UPI00313D8D74